MKPDKTIKTADGARSFAIDWQGWASEQAMYWSELAEWQAYFEWLAEKYPELKEEFKENGII